MHPETTPDPPPRATAVASFLPLLALAGGLAARLARAQASFLHPDEALHLLLASQTSVSAAYRAALTNAHPPLLVLLLYSWRSLGQSELMLRLPSVLAGTACCWVVYQWLEQVTDRSTALVGLLLCAFAPALIELSAEIRQYALLLFFMSACLYLAERALREDSWRWMILFSLSLLGALLTHYSSLIFALAMGVYLLVRQYPYGKSPRAFAAWMGGQAAALALTAYFLATHVARLRQIGMPQRIAETWLRQSIYHPGEGNAAVFAWAQTWRVFTFLLGNGVGGALALLAFLVGLASLLRRQGPVHERGPRPRQLALLLGLPFVVSCGTALAGLYPYGGTRHDAFLALFALSGASLGLAAWQPAREWIKPLSAAALLALCNFFPAFPRAMPPAGAERDRASMHEAVADLRASAPPGSILLADYQSGLLLGFYACGHGIVQVGAMLPLAKSDCGPYVAITTGPQQWSLQPEELDEELASLAQTYHLAPGTKVWWFDAGSIGRPAPRLRRKLLRLGWPDSRSFGDNILLCQLTVG
ncbi:MAG TPA: glycosyltransferase family 39 protein [Thermoanaerobaculia bacterium]